MTYTAPLFSISSVTFIFELTMGCAALRLLFFLLVVKPFLLLAVGINVRRRDRFAAAGPALIVANHNSHLDALVLMAMLSCACCRACDRWRRRIFCAGAGGPGLPPV